MNIQGTNDYGRNAKLYAFLATNYDIKSLASKITATSNAQTNLLNLKKRVNGSGSGFSALG